MKGRSIYSKKTQALMKRFVVFLILSLVVTSILGSAVITARASYGPWVEDPIAASTEEKPESLPEDGHKDDTQKKDVSTIESFAAWLIASPGYAFDEAIKSSGIDASVSGIVMGRVAGGVNYFQFDLGDTNTYGIIGATLYVGIRALAMTALIIFVLVNVIKSLFYSDVKAFSEMKQSIMGGILAIVVMLLMPQFIDWMCKFRDTLSLWLYGLAKDFSGNDSNVIASSVNLAADYRKAYEEHSDLVNAIIYTAVCFLPVTWIVNYVKIAITELVLFGAFPMFCAMGAKDKKAVSNWATVFITNLFTPSIDLVLLFIPQMIITAMESSVLDASKSYDTAASVGWELLKAVITITSFMFIIPAREQLLKMLGNNFGVKMGGGLFAAGAAIGGAASAAAGAAKDLAGGIGGLLKKDGPDGGDSPDGGDDAEAEDPAKSIGGNGMNDVEASPDDNGSDNNMPDDNMADDEPDDNNEDDNNTEAEDGENLSEDEQMADNENEYLAEGEDAADELESDQAAEEESPDEMQEEAELDEGNASDASDVDDSEIDSNEDSTEDASGETDYPEADSSDDASGDDSADADSTELPENGTGDEADDTSADADADSQGDAPEMGHGADETAADMPSAEEGTEMRESGSDGDTGSADESDMPSGADASQDATADAGEGASADMPEGGTSSENGGDISEGEPADMPSEGGSDTADADTGDISDGAPADMPSEARAGDNEDIPEGEPADMPPVGGSGSVMSESVQNDVNDTVDNASVSASDLSGGSDVFDSIEDKANKALGDLVKDNSPSGMENLNMDRAANLKTMDNIKDEMGKLDDKNTALEADAGSIRSQMQANNIEMQNIREDQSKFLKTAPVDEHNNLTPAAKATNDAMNAKVNSLRKDNMELAKKGAGIESQIAHNNSVKAGLSQELSKRGADEKKFASQAAGLTGNGQTFKSSADMAASLKHESNVRKLATYKNYNASQFKGTMSPQDRAEYAKSQRRAEAAGKIASGAAKAAQAYATAVATVAMMGGGAEAAMDAGKTVKEATSGLAGGAAKVTESVVSGEALANAKAVAAGTKDKVVAMGNGAKAAGGAVAGAAKAVANGDVAAGMVHGTFKAARAGKSAVQGAAQKSVDFANKAAEKGGAVLKEGHKLATDSNYRGSKLNEAGKKAWDTAKKPVTNNVSSFKKAWEQETGKSKPTAESVGQNKGTNKGSGKKTASGSDRATEYTRKNINMNDPVNASREAEASKNAENNVREFKNGK